MGRKTLLWALDEIEALVEMMAADELSLSEMAAKLDRSKASVQGKAAWLRDSRWAKKASRPGYVRGSQRTCQANFETPRARRNDCHKHLSLILSVHGRGYPVCGRAA